MTPSSCGWTSGRLTNSKTLGKGTDIIFLHGWGADASAFFFAAKKLSRSFRATVVDFPGFGESPEPERAYTVNDYAQEIISLMDNLKIERAIFIGHSFGGRVAIELAVKFKERVISLVLIDSAGLKPRRKPSYYLRVYLHKLLKKLGFSGLKGSADYRKLSETMRGTFINAVNYDQSSLLSEIACPTAIFWGKEDRETPPYMAKKLKKGIANSEVFWLNGGHFSYSEDFETFYPILLSFLRSTEKTEKDELSA